ncbi:MAG: hypothetical protein HDQ99_00175 [Lachnospiraceae bacterium]|nr:hypothetical protein [Lachnospiraceae bacterium]
MNRKKKEITFYIMTILACLAAMTVVVVAALLIYDKIRQKDEAVEANAEIDVVMYSEEEVNLMLAEAVAQAEQSAREETADSILNQLLQSLEGGTSTVGALRPFYPNHIVVVSNGRFHFVPIRDDLKQHSLLQENLQVLETGELQYVENGEVISHKGIDVSRYQGNIDWNKVAAQGVEYVIIRVGIRGWGQEGTLVLDEKFEDNIKGASAAGLKVGVYFFSQAITEEEALEEADLVLDAIAGYDVSYPIVYDVEKTSEASGRMNQLSVEDRTRMAHIFLDRIKEAGYTPMIYANMEMWSVLINMAEFEDVDKWFAYYDTDLYFPYEYAIWQYSDTGRIDGIGGDVDLNISFKEW